MSLIEKWTKQLEEKAKRIRQESAARVAATQLVVEFVTDGARFQAISEAGPNGTIRIDDERGLCPQYIHWGVSAGKTLAQAVDEALRPPPVD